MSLDGTWQLTLSSPMGDNYATAEFVTNAEEVSGKYTGLGTTEDIVEGSVVGDRVRWTVYRKQPIEWATKFDMTLQGADAMAGEVEVGTFGSYKVTGERR
ncbi:hypothetical protein CSH63_31710 [Micromonospora tulbaghiae]|uniref:Uncharacterized protein n=1 Tax=Micromonospora tulbaghiae TaxID=479978 RepID=A0A386WUQ5_9ACTN|nr:hypothetical protein [Micromonospora tulbaghiae]AYF31941.1 hypothetical protein CSH63_31710 [Micromonospora tulbaghiae]